MNRSTPLMTALLALALALAIPAGATHNNPGTVKVHDNEDENPDVRNVPHVSCDFWVEAFGMSDDSGWLRFYGWPPTGNKSAVTPTGDDLDWEADSGNVSGDFHFKKGPYQLPPGHYRLEIYTDDGHPSDKDHFAKSKTFWVDPCEQPPTFPPCPPNLTAEARSVDGTPEIVLDWDAVANATSYNVYRALEGEDFEYLATVDAPNTTYVDDDGIVAGETYEYYVTAVVNGTESVECEAIEVTAIPFFPSAVLGAVALAGSVAAFVVLRRKA